MKEIVNIQFEGNVVKLTRSCSSHFVSAAILGTVQEHGWEIVILDRRIHQRHDAHDLWRIAGAYTTVLSKPLAKQAN